MARKMKDTPIDIGLSHDEGKEIKKIVDKVVDAIVELTDGKPIFGNKEEKEK